MWGLFFYFITRINTVDNTDKIAREILNTKTRFRIQVGKDARKYFETTIEGMSLEEARSKVSRYGFDAPDAVWEDGPTEDFDNTETICITDEHTGEILDSWSQEDGWENGTHI